MFTLRRFALALALALPLILNGEEPANAPTVLLHRLVKGSCELVEPVTLNAVREYSWLHTKQGEMFSPELGKHSYVSYEQNMPKETVELGRKSGFELRPVAAQSYEARAVDVVGKGQCPSLEEAVAMAENERFAIRQKLQAKVYSFGDPVKVPVERERKPSEQEADDKAFYPAVTGLSSGRQGRVVLEAIVGADGSVKDARVVVRSKTDVDGTAVSAVRTWLFWPARMKGLPVPFRLNIEFEFHRY